MIRSHKELELKLKDIFKENQILHQKNQFILKHYEEMKGKYDDLLTINEKLKIFQPSFKKLQEKLPNYSVDKLIDKFEYFEQMNMNFVKKISEYEDEKLQAEQDAKKEHEKYEAKLQDISLKNQENQRFIDNLRQQMQTQESEILTQDNYKTTYFLLFNKIVHIFNLYS